MNQELEEHLELMGDKRMTLPRVLKDKLLLQVIKEQENKSGLLVLLPTHLPYRLATVKAVGDEVEKISIGDEVYIHNYGGDLIVSDSQEYLVMQEKDILAVVNHS